ncbi:MAG: flagellar export protein FliJ [Nitrospirota bacterium]
MRSPVESLLNLKRWKEDEAKNRFALLLRELATEEAKLHKLEEQYQSLSTRFGGADELINIDEIKRLNEHLEHLLSTIQRQKSILADKEREVEAARRHLADASKDKKIFERLDEKQKHLMEKELRRKEQIGTDEHAVNGHNRHRA